MSWDSKKRVVVTGIGLLSCLGNLEETWNAIIAQKTGLRLAQPFLDLPLYPLGLIREHPSRLKELVEPVVQDALFNAKLIPPLEECGVVIGSSRGCQGEWENSLRNGSIAGWKDMFPHQGSTLAASKIGSHGTVMANMNACSTGIWSILQACQLIVEGSCQQALAGAIDTPITPLAITGFQQLGVLANQGYYPFDLNREGLALGEGAALLVLESLESALNRGVTPYAEIKGFAANCDAYHMVSPEPKGVQGIKAIKQCLERSELTPEDIDLIFAHGTGTILNDEREARIIQSLFRLDVQVSSIKGAIGHTLGASSAISVALAVLSLKRQMVLPSVGINKPAFPLNLLREARSAKLQNVLIFSFGFGGQNAILALERY